MKISTLIITVLTTLSLSAAELERPPQYVLISFDGSHSHNFWEESLSIAHKNNARFSYFISGVYFVPKSQSLQYTAPRQKAGRSDIGWADEEPEDIRKRTEYIWSALENKFDIGSHANGHFDGGVWTYEEWKLEFQYFHKFVEKVFDLVPKAAGNFSNQWAETLRKNMVGFRAPLLAQNLGTQKVLQEFHYTYDASGQTIGKWPFQKKTGVWDISLARMGLAGTNRNTIAMDYNVFYGQCNGKFADGGKECQGLTDRRAKYFEDQMYMSYAQTFLKSYYGNRAPFSVGHHFSLWNRGAYWKALQRFIRDVCTKPEVQCITHKDMVSVMKNYVSQSGPNVISQLNAGNFDKQNISQVPAQTLKVDLALLNPVSISGDEIPEISESMERIMLKGDLPGAHTFKGDDDLHNYRIAE